MTSAAQTLFIVNSTITGNRVPGGSFGGAYLAGTATLYSTIIAGNTVYVPNFDQRLDDGHGYVFPRVVGASADIGAFEYAEVIFADGFEPPPPSTRRSADSSAPCGGTLGEARWLAGTPNGVTRL